MTGGGDTLTQAILDGRISLQDAIAQHRPPTFGEQVGGAAKNLARSAVDALYSGNAALMRLEAGGLDIVGADGFADRMRRAADAMGADTGEMRTDTEGVIGEPAPQLANQGFVGRALTQALPNAVGSSIGMAMVPGPKGAKLGTAIKGSLVGGGTGFYEAKAHGADDVTAWESFAANAALGATEAGIPGLPKTAQRTLGEILARADRASGGGVTKALWEGVKTGFSEVTQESLQQIGSNLVAKVLYDDDRKVLEGMEPTVQGSALYGIIIGALGGHAGRQKHGGAGPTSAEPGISPEPGAQGGAPSEGGNATQRPRLSVEQLAPEAAAAVKSLAAGSQELGWQGTLHPVDATEADSTVRDFVERRGANLQLVESEDGQPLPRPAMYSPDGSVVVVDANAPDAFASLVDHEIGHHVLAQVEGQRESFQATIDRLAPELRNMAADEYRADLVRQAQKGAGRDLTAEEVQQLEQQQVGGDEALARIAEDFSPVVRLLRAKPEAFSVVDDVGFWRGLLRSVLDVGRSITGKPTSQERAVAEVYRSVARTPLSSKIEPGRGVEIAKAVKAFLDSAVGMARPQLAAPASGKIGESGSAARAPEGERGSATPPRARGGVAPIPEPTSFDQSRPLSTTENARGRRLVDMPAADLEQVRTQRIASEDRRLREQYPDRGEAWYQRVAELRRQARDPQNPEGDRAALQLRRAGIAASGANVEEIEDALRVQREAAAGPRGRFGQTIKEGRENVGQGPQYAIARRQNEESQTGTAPPRGGVGASEAAPGSEHGGSEVRAAAIQVTDDFARKTGADPQASYALYRRAYPISNGGSELTWDATQNFVTFWQNAWKPVQAWRDALAKAGLVTDRNDVYLKEELRRGKTKYRQTEEREAVVKPVFDAIKASGLDLGDVELYLLARNAADRNALVFDRTGRTDGSGMSDAAAAKIVATAQGGPNAAAYRDIAAKFDALTKRTRDLWVEYGLETRPNVDAMEQAQPNFAPMRSDPDVEPVFGDRPPPKGTGQGRGITVRGREFKAALGRGSMAEYPLAYAAADLDNAIVRGEKGRVFEAAYNLAKAQNDPRFALVDVPPMKETLDKSGKVRKVPDFQLAEHEVAGKINGELRRIRFNKEWTRIADAMKNADTETGGAVVRAIAPVTRTLAKLSTQWNPIFPFVNAPRDFLSAFLTTTAEHGIVKAAKLFNPKTIAQAYNSLRTNDEWAQLFKKSGAPVSFLDLSPTAEKRSLTLQREIEQLRHPDAPWKMTRKYAAKVGQAISNLNEMAESATRLAAFRGAVESGMTDERAASFSKNLTTNFERKGSAAWLSSMYAFSNAGIQGTARIAEAVRKPGARKLIVGMIAGAALLDVMNREFGGDDDDGVPYYDKIPDWVKRANAIVMLPGTGGKRIQIPLPYGWGWFHVLGTEGSRAVYSGDATRAAGEIIGSAFDQYNPLGGGDAVDTITPTLARPIEQMSRNKDWAGRRIFPDEHGPTPASELAWDDTNPVLRDIARWLNSATGGNAAKSGLVSISPVALEKLWTSYMGGVGGESGRLAKLFTSAATGDQIEFSDIPLWRRYVGANSLADQRSFFREQVSRVEQVAKRAKSGEDVSGDPLYRMRHRVGPWREQASDLQDQIMAASGEEKQALRDKLRKLMLRVTKEIVSASPR